MHTSLALIALTGAMLRRLLREGIVLRSLAFPVVLTVGTLLATLVVVATLRPPDVVALAPGTSLEVQHALIDRGLRIVITEDPAAYVESGRAVAGLIGTTLHTPGADRNSLLAEAGVRQALGASWRIEPPPLPDANKAGSSGAVIAYLLCAIYTLYGVVFGAGMVARDRDDGTFEVELSLPVPRWVHGVTRMLAGTLVLVTFVVLSILLVHSLNQVTDLGGALRNGVAACIGTTAIGLGTVGGASIRSGFAASLAAGLTVATGMLTLGWQLPTIGQYIPVSSLVAGGSGWIPLVGAVVLTVPAIALFTVRTAKA